MLTMRRVLLCGTAAIAVFAGPALGADDVNDRLDRLQAMIEAQQKQIADQQAEIAKLRAKSAPKPKKQAAPETAIEPAARKTTAAFTGWEDAPRPVATLAAAETPAPKLDTKTPAEPPPKWSFNSVRPVISSADGRTTLGIRGRVQLDGAHYIQDDEGPLATDYRRGSQGSSTNRENTAARDLSSGFNFRRALLGIEGKIEEDFGYKLVAEFGGSGTETQGRINDAYFNYTGLAPFTFQVGAFSPPANLEDGTGNDASLFMERASPAELSRSLAGADGRYAVGFRANEEAWFAALHWTGGVVTESETFDEQQAIVARLAARPFYDKDYSVHVGANVSYVYEPADQGEGVTPRTPLRFRDRPELRVDSTRLIDTGSIDAESGYAAGVEFAAAWKNIGIQAEYFEYGIERVASAGLADPDFDGFYAQAHWVITGETRKYKPDAAGFASPKPAKSVTESGGTGAFEAAVRYSNVDLDFHEGLAGAVSPADGVRGGEQSNWTLAVNWYPTSTLKFGINYIMVDVDRLNPASVANPTPFGAGAATPPVGVQIGQDLDILAARLQFSM
jgi:phosphate-selective porin OprO/OprP